MLPIRFQAYKYDPYEKKFTIEQYDHAAMQNIRLDAVQRSKKARRIGIILGTLGRQGSSRVHRFLEKRFRRMTLMKRTYRFPMKDYISKTL